MKKNPTLSDFRQQKQNANQHTERGMALLEESMRDVGYTAPMIAAADGEIISGSARHEKSAEVFGPDVQPLVVETDGKRPVVVIRKDVPNAKDKRAQQIALAENRVAEVNLNWDDGVLKLLNDQGLMESMWTGRELAQLLGSPDAGADAEPKIDQAKKLRRKWKTKPGQLWKVGDHRLLCGDSTNAKDVARLLDNSSPWMMVTDPPYGVEYDPAWRQEAGVNKNGKKMGKVQNDDNADWTPAWRLFPGAVAYVYHAGLMAAVVQASLERSGFTVRSQIVWVKDRMALSRGDYHWQHEPVWYAVRTGSPSLRTDDRTQTTVWNIQAREDSGHGHGTQKPTECMARPMRNHNADQIYDPFVGSGTTIVAAQNLGRICLACEISPEYVAVALQRMQDAFPGITIALSE